MSEGRSGLGWIVNVVVIVILLWVGWLVSDLSKRVGSMEETLKQFGKEATEEAEEKPGPGPGPIITVEPDPSPGSKKVLWMINYSAVQFGESGYIREDLIGGGVNVFVAKPLNGNVEVAIKDLTIKTTAHGIGVTRSGGLVWTVDGATLQACTYGTGGGHQCVNDGLPPEFDGDLDGSIQALKEAGGSIQVGRATMQAKQ